LKSKKLLREMLLLTIEAKQILSHLPLKCTFLGINFRGLFVYFRLVFQLTSGLLVVFYNYQGCPT